MTRRGYNLENNLNTRYESGVLIFRYALSRVRLCVGTTHGTSELKYEWIMVCYFNLIVVVVIPGTVKFTTLAPT